MEEAGSRWRYGGGMRSITSISCSWFMVFFLLGVAIAGGGAHFPPK